MIFVRFLLLVHLLAYVGANSMSATFESCTLQCSQDRGYVPPNMPGEMCDKREFEALRLKVNKLEDQLEKLSLEAMRKPLYSFKITSTTANFHDAREMCRNMGGDLLNKNLGVEGKQYHQIIGEAVASHAASEFWIGVSDVEDEGIYKSVTGEIFDFTFLSNNIWHWGIGQPDDAGGNEDCIHFWRNDGGTVNDRPCTYLNHAICEIPL